MTSSARLRDERVRDVRCDEHRLSVDLMDGRTITVPLSWYPNLLNAAPSARANWESCGGGFGIHWPEIDEDLITEGLLRGEPISMPISDVCEVRTNSGWETIDIGEALGRRGEDMRCPECRGRVDPHREYSDGARAHFEHRVKHAGCSTKLTSFCGTSSFHPDALQ